MIDSMKKSWDGEERLWVVFWLWGVAVPIVLYGIAYYVSGFIPSLGYVFDVVLGIGYAVFMMVSLWRCAFNIGWKWLGYVNRFFACMYIFTILSVVSGLLNGTNSYAEGRWLMSDDYAQISKICQEELTEEIMSNGSLDNVEDIGVGFALEAMGRMTDCIAEKREEIIR